MCVSICLWPWHHFSYTIFYSALAVGDPHARVPYQQLRSEHIIGLPSGVKFCHPSNLSNDQLEVIYRNIAHIKFIGKFYALLFSFKLVSHI